MALELVRDWTNTTFSIVSQLSRTVPGSCPSGRWEVRSRLAGTKHLPKKGKEERSPTSKNKGEPKLMLIAVRFIKKTIVM